MARKIVRDLNKAENRGSFTIHIKDEDLAKSVSKKKKNILDISQVADRQIILATEKSTIKDIAKTASGGHENAPQFFYLQVDEEHTKNSRKINEIIRMAGAGVLILVSINLINIYQRGMALKNSIIVTASSGYEQMVTGGQNAKNANFQAAATSFTDAQSSFGKAIETIDFLQSNQDYFFAKEKTVDSVNGLLQAAKSLAGAGQDFSEGIKNLQNLPSLFLQYNRSSQKPADSLTQKLKNDLNFLDKANTEIQDAMDNLSKVSPEVLPGQFQEKLTTLKSTVQKILNSIASAQNRLPAILDLLGDRYPHRYLILLQNDAEARPTGGFIGSYILAELNDGYLTKFDFHDIYETDGQLQEEIPAPEDIASITKNWRMRDSNYSPDFSISAEKAAWFLQKEKGPSVDTVIAVNQSFLADLLALTGPVQVPGLQAPLDQNNYQTVLSYIIESKLSGDNSPKKILKDFIGAFQSKLFSGGNLSKVLSAFIQGYKNKNLLFYSRYENIQSMFDGLGMTGRVDLQNNENAIGADGAATGTDYLSVISTAIGGNKSDLYINQQIKHNTLLAEDGSLTDEVTITRKHLWSEKDLELMRKTLKTFGFENLNDGLIDILGRGINKSIIKVYVPKGSVFIDAYLIDKTKVATRYDDQINKTYFMFQMDVPAGAEKKVTLSYKLPGNLNLTPVGNYKLFVQKQPGLRASEFSKKFFFKPGLESYKEYPIALKKDQDGWLEFIGNLKNDLYMGAVVGK